jgi:tripartite-type tricarboxylate transporter receptor subunit TctC
MRLMGMLVCSVLMSAGPVVGTAIAQEYPTRSIRFIVPFPPGGGTDITARSISTGLTESLGQTVVVDNRAGAGGVIGADMAAKAAPDGYTILLGSPGPLTINPNLGPVPYDVMRDFSPISLVTMSPFLLLVNPTVPAKTVRDLIALSKAKPDSLNFGTAGIGSVAHLGGEQFKAISGAQIMHVPYKGASQSLIALLAGEAQIGVESLPVVLSHIRSGKLRALAVGSRTRSTIVPEIPTMQEAGVPGYEQTTASGVLAPARTPTAIINRLNTEIVRILQKPEVREQLVKLGTQGLGGTPEQYAEHLRNEFAMYARVIKLAGVKLDQ